MAQWGYQGTKLANSTYFIVEDYFNKKLLKDLGYTFDYNSLEQWEVEAYSIIANEVAKLQARDAKSRRK
jgi:glucose-6-phosphate isomerase